MSARIVMASFGASEIVAKSSRGIASFALDAAVEALADAKLSRDEIDGYVGAPYATNAGSPHAEGGDEISVKTVTNMMGLKLTWAADLYRRYPTDMVRDRKSTRLNSSHLEHLVCRLLLEKKKKAHV